MSVVNKPKIQIPFGYSAQKAQAAGRPWALSGGGEVWEDTQSGLLGDFLAVEGQLQMQNGPEVCAQLERLPNASEIRFSQKQILSQTFLWKWFIKKRLPGEAWKGWEAGRGRGSQAGVWSQVKPQLQPDPRDRLWSRNGPSWQRNWVFVPLRPSTISLGSLWSRAGQPWCPRGWKWPRSAQPVELGNGARCWEVTGEGLAATPTVPTWAVGTSPKLLSWAYSRTSSQDPRYCWDILARPENQLVLRNPSLPGASH